MIAALYVETGGVYYGLPDVDPWDKARDARLYPGPWPVVAHPPCNRWSTLAAQVETRYGYKQGEDGGCFESALSAIRSFGGVIEHPAHSAAMTRDQRTHLRHLIDQAKRRQLDAHQPPPGRNQEARRATYRAYYQRNRARILARRAASRAA